MLFRGFFCINIMEKLTLEKYRELHDAAVREEVPLTLENYDCIAISIFDDTTVFKNCKFGWETSFGQECYFDKNCVFDSKCSFGACSEFDAGCVFPACSRFGSSCRFGNNCQFDNDCWFAARCKFGYNCIFGYQCTFAELCSFGGNAIVENAYHLINFIKLQGFGRRESSDTYFFNCKEGIIVRSDFFIGTIEEFQKEIKDEKGDKCYLDACRLAEKKFKRSKIQRLARRIFNLN